MPELAFIKSTLVSQAIHLFFAFVALVLGAVAIKVIDRFLLKKIDLEEEIARGNLAAAVLAGALWIALAMILSRAG